MHACMKCFIDALLQPSARASSKVIKYSFSEIPEWLDKNSDVMYLCKLYLNELERFVSEAENLMKEKNE